MSNKIFYALCLALMVFVSPARANDPAFESIDAFARQTLDRQRTGPTASGLELVFTQGDSGKNVSAYLLIDGRYGKDVSVGASVNGWKVRKIAEDHIEIAKGARSETLMMHSELRSMNGQSGASLELGAP